MWIYLLLLACQVIVIVGESCLCYCAPCYTWGVFRALQAVVLVRLVKRLAVSGEVLEEAAIPGGGGREEVGTIPEVTLSSSESRNGELRTQKLKSHLVRIQSLNVLPLKPGVGQYIAIHATLTARDFFLTYFYPSGPFTCIFSKTPPEFFLCWLWLKPVPVLVCRIK